MLPHEFTQETHLQLVPGEPPNEDGCEKIVYKVTDGMQFIAAKVYRQKNATSYEKINRSHDALEEFTTYQILRKTQLAPYVPSPLGLIRENSKVVGLLLEWRNGKEELGANYGRLFLSSDTANSLEQGLLSLHRGQWLNTDCFSEYNLCMGDRGLWFAELKRENRYRTQEEYESVVRNKMKSLREEYVRG